MFSHSQSQVNFSTNALIFNICEVVVHTSYSMVLQIIRADILRVAGRGKMRAMSKMSASIICNTIE